MLASSFNVLSRLYRKVSSKVLDIAVTPHLLGDVPESDAISVPNKLTFYVLREYSRSNSLLVDLKTKELGLPPALAAIDLNPVVSTDNQQKSLLGLESSAIIFVERHSSAKDEFKHSPRLQRLINALKTNTELVIELIPVTILWGRAPEKEDSILKLLTIDNWREPTIAKQLFNIGVHGREAYVQFHEPQHLGQLVQQAQTENPGRPIANVVEKKLRTYLATRREMILGPDLSDKRNVIDKLLESPAIKKAISDKVETDNLKPSLVRQEAREYLEEIASDYAYPIIRIYDRFLTWLWTQLYDGVEVNHFEKIQHLGENHQVVYVPCHRSHIDYLLLSYVIYKRGLMIPYVAAGNNLNLPVLGALLRSGGAFFLRRSFKGNALYGSVFKEYLYNVISRNTPLEYFVEGGRSRSGRLLPPKTGMLAMTVHSQLRGAGKPIVFVPTYIGYERLMEGATYVKELRGKPKESESLVGLLRASRKIERIFGRVHVSFGNPLYLKDFMEKFDVRPNSLDNQMNDTALPEAAQKMVNNIAVKIMQQINRAAVVNPVSLLSLVLLSTPKYALDEVSCLEQLALYQHIATSLPYDAATVVTPISPKEIINYGLKLKLIERKSHLLGDMITVAPNQAVLLSYFRNNILHAFILSSLIASLVQHNGRMWRHDIDSIIELLYPFIQGELFLKWRQADISKTIAVKLDALIEQGLVLDDTSGQVYAPEPNTEKFSQLAVLAMPVQQSLERYFLTLALLSQQGSGKLTAEQIVDLCHLLGERLSVLYESDSPEFFDRALFTSFINALIRVNYLTKDEAGVLHFDERIDEVAENARFVLDLDVMHILKQVASLSNEEINSVMADLQRKKERKFALGKKATG